MGARWIGAFEVSPIGLGCMPLSIEGRPDRERATATIHAALDAGVTLFDTADSYHWHAGEEGHNETLLAEALAGRADDVVVATKGGRGRPGDGTWTIDAHPERLRAACEGSLRRLRVEAIDLYQLHHPDRLVPYADSLGAIHDLLAAGKIRTAGISNVDTARVLLAKEILGDALVSVQNEHSVSVRDSTDVLALCDNLGLAFLPWGPLGGIGKADEQGAAFAEVAVRHGVSPQRVCLAWLLAQSPVVVPIPGSSRPETIRDSAAAPHLELTAADLTHLDSSQPR